MTPHEATMRAEELAQELRIIVKKHRETVATEYKNFGPPILSITEMMRERGHTFTSEEGRRAGERYTAEKCQRVQSAAIRFVELLSMDPETAQKIQDQGPEQMLKRGFEQSYPGWVKDGLLKKE
jgi:hypothetical protein